MACSHKYRDLPRTYPSGHKSVAMKRCVRCGKTVETYMWLKILLAILLVGGAALWLIGYLASQQ